MITPDREFVTLADRAGAPGGQMAIRRFRNEGAPQVVFAHATGMCASAYNKYLGFLAPEFDIRAPDMRGHGQSALPTEGIKLRNWSVYARDLEAMLLSQPQPEEGWRLMGHSMGGVTSLIVASRGKVKISHLVLIEPVIVPMWASLMAKTPAFRLMKHFIPIAKRAKRRRASWPSYDHVERSYGRKGFFKVWADGVVADYLEDGLTETGDGVTLSCAPSWEAATFGAQGQNFWHYLDKMQVQSGIKVQVFVAERDTTAAPEARVRLAQQGIDVAIIDGAGHLLPQEMPQKLAELAGDALR